MGNRICSFPDCGRKAVGRGLCNGHWKQDRQGQELRPLRHREMTVAGRFERSVVKTPGGCWLWRGYRMSNGYGLMAFHGTTELVHRAVLISAGVTIPDGYHVDHLCRVRSCVNPMHLEPVPPGVNTRRSPYTLPSIAAAKVQCVHGHPFTADNTYIDGLGKRSCRTCRRAADQRRKPRGRSA